MNKLWKCHQTLRHQLLGPVLGKLFDATDLK